MNEKQVDDKVECQHCRAKIGVNALIYEDLLCHPPIEQTICPVCEGVIEEHQDDADDGSYDIDLSEVDEEFIR